MTIDNDMLYEIYTLRKILNTTFQHVLWKIKPWPRKYRNKDQIQPFK